MRKMTLAELQTLVKKTRETLLTSNDIVPRAAYPYYHDYPGIPRALMVFKEMLGHYRYVGDVSSRLIHAPSDVVYNKENHPERNRNFQEIKTFGRMNWQRARNYGKRNYSELCIQRYKRILGNTLHARELSRQKTEAMIGCGVLNKMTGIGMPMSFKIN